MNWYIVEDKNSREIDAISAAEWQRINDKYNYHIINVIDTDTAKEMRLE